MNNLNSEWDHYLMQFRLRSARRKTRMRLEDLEKKLLMLNRERNELWKQQLNLGWIELDPPVMRGWKRYFVLRADVARSKHAAFFQGILDKINTLQYSDKKAFTEKKRKCGRKIQAERTQKLLEPDARRFKVLNFNERERQCFYEVIESNKKYSWKKYVFVEPWRFVLNVRPNVITKTKVKDFEIERRINEIDQYFEQRDLKGKLDKLLHGYDRWSYWDDDVRRKERRKFNCIPLRELLDEIKTGSTSE